MRISDWSSDVCSSDLGRVEIGGRVGDGAIMSEHRRLQRGRHVAPGILEQRDEIIGRMPRQRVLKVEQNKTKRLRPRSTERGERNEVVRSVRARWWQHDLKKQVE